MKRSRLLRRLMTLAIVSEVAYMLFTTVLFIFRPGFYDSAVVSLFGANINQIPVNNPDMTLASVLFGGVIIFFVFWFALKLSMDKDINPSILSILMFLVLPATVIVYRLMYGSAKLKAAIDGGTDALSFLSMHFRVLEYVGWLNLAAYIFMLMASAVCEQRFSDLD